MHQFMVCFGILVTYEEREKLDFLPHTFVDWWLDKKGFHRRENELRIEWIYRSIGLLKEHPLPAKIFQTDFGHYTDPWIAAMPETVEIIDKPINITEFPDFVNGFDVDDDIVNAYFYFVESLFPKKKAGWQIARVRS